MPAPQRPGCSSFRIFVFPYCWSPWQDFCPPGLRQPRPVQQGEQASPPGVCDTPTRTPPEDVFGPLAGPARESRLRLGVPSPSRPRPLEIPAPSPRIGSATPQIDIEDAGGEACLLRCSHPARTPARTMLAPPSASTFWVLTCCAWSARTARTTTAGIGVGYVCVREGAREQMKKPKIRILALVSQQGGPRTDRGT